MILMRGKNTNKNYVLDEFAKAVGVEKSQIKYLMEICFNLNHYVQAGFFSEIY